VYTPVGNVEAFGGTTAYLAEASFTHLNELAQEQLTNGETEVDQTFIALMALNG